MCRTVPDSTRSKKPKTNSRPQSFHFPFFVLKHNSLYYRRINVGRHIGGTNFKKNKIRLAERDGSRRLRNNREMIKIQQSRVFLTPSLIFRCFCVFAHYQLKKVVESLEIVETISNNDRTNSWFIEIENCRLSNINVLFITDLMMTCIIKKRKTSFHL